MDHGLTGLYRAVPLATALFCFAYGASVFASGSDPARFTAGPVLFFLGPPCLALFCLTAVTLRRIAGRDNAAARYLYPAAAYALALLTIVCGIFIVVSHTSGALVAGHAVCGLGLVTGCIATAVTVSARSGRSTPATHTPTDPEPARRPTSAAEPETAAPAENRQAGNPPKDPAVRGPEPASRDRSAAGSRDAAAGLRETVSRTELRHRPETGAGAAATAAPSGISARISASETDTAPAPGHSKSLSRGQASMLIALVSLTAAAAWTWSILLYLRGSLPAHFMASCFQFGSACVCTAFIAPVVVTARRIRGSHTAAGRHKWTGIPLAAGLLAFVSGVIVLIAFAGYTINFAGFILIGSACICWSIASCTALLGAPRDSAASCARRMSAVPVIMTAALFFLAAFLFEISLQEPKLLVAARILVGYGAFCFALYAATSALGSGIPESE